MKLDELIGRLTHLRAHVGGDAKVGMHPRIFYSDRPSFVTTITTEDFADCELRASKYVPVKYTNVVVLK